MFVLALVPLSLIFGKAKAAYEFSESKEKLNHLLFMDDLKLYSRSEKGLDSLVQTVCVFSEDIGMEFGIEKCAMLVMEKGKIVKSVRAKLNGANLVRGGNTWVVSLLRYSAAFASWRKSDLQAIERLGSCLPYMEHYTLSQM